MNEELLARAREYMDAHGFVPVLFDFCIELLRAPIDGNIKLEHDHSADNLEKRLQRLEKRLFLIESIDLLNGLHVTEAPKTISQTGLLSESGNESALTCNDKKRTGPPYSIKDSASNLEQLCKRGMTDRQIAELYGCAELTVVNTRKRYGIKSGRAHRKEQNQEKQEMNENPRVVDRDKLSFPLGSGYASGWARGDV